ncbi:MAG: dTDP-4-dehydrorhamnose reductase [Candidatus Ancaeobacter aquaticus]|nr:dTDP-4-dehydrorhamnose reductase [Candidatus Ancaeobacter aquaticus]
MTSSEIKYLVLGANGLLGAQLTAYLGKNCIPIYGPHSALSDPDAYRIDISNEKKVRELILKVSPDVVVNTVAMADVDWCEKNSVAAYAVNGHGVEYLATACNEVSASFVQISTDYMFDGSKQSPYTEEDPPNPINEYGKSKLLGEEMARIADKHLIVRVAWLYGDYKTNFACNIVDKARRNQMQYVIADQIGTPTYTKDVSDTIVQLVNRSQTGIYHVVNGGACSRYQQARKICEIAGFDPEKINPIQSKKSSRIAIRPHYSVLDTAKLVDNAHISMRPWQEAISEYVKTLL